MNRYPYFVLVPPTLGNRDGTVYKVSSESKIDALNLTYRYWAESIYAEVWLLFTYRDTYKIIPEEELALIL